MYRPSAQRTRERILEAFLRLAVERGIDPTTTRAVALEAGVSELTIFRHFGDKATLARAAISQAVPVERLRSYEVAFDVSTPEQVVDGLTACLCYLRDELRQREHMLQLALSES